MKCVFIIFYFGKLPNYFPLFLKSCGEWQFFSWRIYTDQEIDGYIPSNVMVVSMSFNECRKLFAEKLPFSIDLHTPKKLCDFKPVYGYILEDSLQSYDYWGYSDLDVIWGNMEDSLLEKITCDKNFSLGHCTLYRNTPEINRRILSFESCKNALASPVMQAFDEWGKNAVNVLFPGSGYTASEDAPGLDIWPETTLFYRSFYQKKFGRYAADFSHMGIVHIYDQKVYWCYFAGDEVIEKEYPYVHLQKRKLKIQLMDWNAKEYYIVPGRITDQYTSSRDALKDFEGKRIVIDRQWLRLKWFNIRRRTELLALHCIEKCD